MPDLADWPVLVTGGAGFIGSHVVDCFEKAGRTVVVIDDLSTGRRANLSENVQFYRLSIVDPDLQQLLEEVRPSLVVHCAAQISVTASIHDPERDLHVNVHGTLRVLQACRRAGVDRFVFLSSGGAIYGETEAPARESDEPRPTSVYGIHKLAAEYHVKLSGLSYSILRPSNVYGPRQRDDQEGGVVSIFGRRGQEDQTIPITGSGGQSRDFIHVRDVVKAVMMTSSLKNNGTWNVSTGRATTILDLAHCVEQATGKRLGRCWLDERPGDVYRSCLDSTLLQRETNWRPRVTLHEGLTEMLRGGD